MLITSFDLDGRAPDPGRRTWKSKLFHNFPGPDSDGGLPVWKVGLSTAAAPTCFPSFEGYIDGGVYANNPSMCGLAPVFPPAETYALDEWEKVPEMIDFAERVDVRPAARFLRRTWMRAR